MTNFGKKAVEGLIPIAIEPGLNGLCFTQKL